MRIAVTGTQGQVAQAMAARGPHAGVEVMLVGRPALDLSAAESILPALRAARPDAIVSAAAYTAVDLAESETEAAFAVNADGAGYVSEAAKALGVPLLHLSTDYVFDGALDRPYREDDATGPMSVYGASKLKGETAVLRNRGSVFRTAWVYSPFGRNFVKTMMTLAQNRAEVRVVADQVGCPTSAFDIADALIGAAKRMQAAPDDAALRGVFHLAGAAESSWCAFAQGIFDILAARGGPQCRAEPIPASEYPTPARRPANSRLDGAKLKAVFGIALPGWHEALPDVMAQVG
jgi:dTDP-4-dehydrorhamnose reductase